MCHTYFINDKCVTTIGELKEHIDPITCIDSSYFLEGVIVTEFSDTECLCPIDPLLVAVRTDQLVLCDPIWHEYTFIKRK